MVKLTTGSAARGSMTGLAALVNAELSKLPIDRSPEYKTDSVWMRCPFHSGGMEKTPSFKINLTSPKAAVGHCYCFGCHQSMPWNTLAELYQLAKFRQSAIKQAQQTTFDLNLNLEEPVPPDYKRMFKWPETLDWRGINGATVTEMNGRTVRFGKHVMLYLPITTRGDNVGGILCKMERNDPKEKAYFNVDGGWASSALIGYDIARARKGPLWVVEGPRDTANIIQHGGRAVGLIGSAVTSAKLRLIKALDPPSIIRATDPDDAGDGADKLLKDGLSDLFATERYPYDDGDDGAKLTKAEVTEAIKYMKKKHH
jgi:5S rRNA maturation endonuclease (ribonuclease M5)